MRGLTDEERRVLSDTGPCACSFFSDIACFSADDQAVLNRLLERGLIVDTPCTVVGDCHPITTSLGRLAIELDAAANRAFEDA